jgi:hypothetical protein
MALGATPFGLGSFVASGLVRYGRRLSRLYRDRTAFPEGLNRSESEGYVGPEGLTPGLGRGIT